MTQTRRLLLSTLLCAFAMPALASEAKKEGGEPYVKLAPVALPVTENGRVINYLFVTLRINLTAKADVNALRLKEPYFRDLLIRAAHKQSFALPNKRDTLDEARFKKVMIPEFTKIAGAGNIETLEILAQNPKKLMN
ncbi:MULTISPECIES: hypothetical protein [Asticcacaulis]|jgi:hypothetical protein|uniref:Uncharacterized protein n=1 Tax=Asticcacaulis excentricus TaxID=78587 RepID=A0A3G9G4F8_9CAUL|nr:MULTISPECIES: hypothetical protein [Asticcacaulis]MCA1936093.1 hypothetical protein [Asticcacaulis sp.]BBF82212.1 hypothetical protein EM6_2844 [Asticcacaulis excentricus]